MNYTTATVNVQGPTGFPATIDLDGLRTSGDMFDAIREAFGMETEDDELPDGYHLSNPQGFAVHLFQSADPQGDRMRPATEGQSARVPVANFDELLSAWSDETDDDRREAMGEYLEDMGASDLSDFDEAYQGQYSSEADFAEHICADLGIVPKDLPSWVAIDWEQTWYCGLRHDYHITDSGHVFRSL